MKYYKHTIYQQYYRVYPDDRYEVFLAWCKTWQLCERKWSADFTWLDSHGIELIEVSELEVLIILGPEAVKKT